jgi:malonyl-CoA decarboxylase
VDPAALDPATLDPAILHPALGMNFFQDMLASISERKRALIERSQRRTGVGANRLALSGDPLDDLDKLCRILISGSGEASGVAIASEILERYSGLDGQEKAAFFRRLVLDFGPDREALRAAFEAYDKDPKAETLRGLLRRAEPPRQELFRRLNLAPGGTSRLVALRGDLIEASRSDPELAALDDDLQHLLRSWFNRGFLVLNRITWSTPADILERIIRYEAVHEISSWADLQRRLAPPDRRCYAFFHPSLVADPLVFVEVALTREIPASVEDILTEERPFLAPEEANTAVFYSISNCHTGLRGVTFGNFLIKQVVEELARDLPALKTFVTLSPAPAFRRWLTENRADPERTDLTEAGSATLALLDAPGWVDDAEAKERLRPLMLGLAADYYLNAKIGDGRPLDPVARFHLGNGARLERLNWPGDPSAKGISAGAGLMVNYLYDLRSIEANHEAFANQQTVAVSPQITKQLREFNAKYVSEAKHV